MRLTIFLISALLPLSFAQTSDVSNSTTHSVQVGGSGLIFIPNTVNAAVRDQVQFHFYPYNHSVVQSTYDAPCMAIAGGIYSGFVPVKSGESVSRCSLSLFLGRQLEREMANSDMPSTRLPFSPSPSTIPTQSGCIALRI